MRISLKRKAAFVCSENRIENINNIIINNLDTNSFLNKIVDL